MSFTPCVSILVSTKNRRDDLKKLISSLLELEYPHDRFEIVLIEETDDPSPIEHPLIRYHTIPSMNKGFGYTRNVALQHANYDIVVFTDDDCIVEKDWLKYLVEPLEDESVGGVGGCVITSGNNMLARCESILGFPSGGLKKRYCSQGKIIPDFHLVTSNCAYRKKILNDVGGFEDDLVYSGEDTILSERVRLSGSLCIYTPKAVVYHKPRGNLWRIFKWFIRRGKSDIDVMRILDEPRLPRIKRSLLFKIFILTVLLVLTGIPLLYSLFITVFIFYCLVLYQNRYCYKIYKDLKLLLLLPAVRFVMDIGTDAGRIIRLFS